MENIFTDENFEQEVLKSSKPVLVDFFAVWCGPCQMMSPIIDEIANELEGRVRVGKLNVDEAPKTAEKYNIMSVPTLLYFKEGKLDKTLVGARTKEDIIKEIS